MAWPAFAQEAGKKEEAPPPASEQQKPAEQETADLNTYSPGYCEFSVKFPEEPSNTRRCEESDGGQCYDLISYTRVYDMSSTVNFRIICNPADGLYEQYKKETIQQTLKAMTARSVVKTFDMSYREEPAYKQAGLVGEGSVGVTPTIYIAQLWIGRHSIMSVEAELIGEPHEEADKLFSDVLQSVTYVPNKKLVPREEDSSAREQPGNR